MAMAGSRRRSARRRDELEQPGDDAERDRSPYAEQREHTGGHEADDDHRDELGDKPSPQQNAIAAQHLSRPLATCRWGKRCISPR